jgi:hypothetical protein
MAAGRDEFLAWLAAEFPDVIAGSPRPRLLSGAVRQSMNASQQREQAIRVARTDFGEALGLAHAVADPWYRCQALAWVARFAPEDHVASVARQATDSAAQNNDFYLSSACLAWPIRALVERGRTVEARDLLTDALAATRRIEHPVRRLSALRLIVEAAWPLGRRTRESLAETLAEACRQTHSWRVGAILHDLALMLAHEDQRSAERYAAFLREGPDRRRCLRALEQGRCLSPRPFFW